MQRRTSSTSENEFMSVLIIVLGFGRIVQSSGGHIYNDNSHTLYNSIYYSPELSGKSDINSLINKYCIEGYDRISIRNLVPVGHFISLYITIFIYVYSDKTTQIYSD